MTGEVLEPIASIVFRSGRESALPDLHSITVILVATFRM